MGARRRFKTSDGAPEDRRELGAQVTPHPPRLFCGRRKAAFFHIIVLCARQVRHDFLGEQFQVFHDLEMRHIANLESAHEDAGACALHIAHQARQPAAERAS